MGFLASLILGFVPMFLLAGFIYWLDRYEKEPKVLLGGVFLWGAVVAAAFAYIVNTFIGIGVYIVTQSESATSLTTGSLVAPLVEESLKGFAVLLVFLAFYKEFDSILDGIVYAAITALGFAASENTFYIYTYGYQQDGWDGLIRMTILRNLVVPWQHPFYTSFIGIGFALARLNRNWLIRIGAPLIGYFIAIFAHSLHNTLSGLGSQVLCIFGSILDWSGWILMFVFIIYVAYNEKKFNILYLKEEVELGIITASQYQAACSGRARSAILFKAIPKRKFRPTSRFFQLCSELVHKKHQQKRMGNEVNYDEIISSLRNEIKMLADVV